MINQKTNKNNNNKKKTKKKKKPTKKQQQRIKDKMVESTKKTFRAPILVS